MRRNVLHLQHEDFQVGDISPLVMISNIPISTKVYKIYLEAMHSFILPKFMNIDLLLFWGFEVDHNKWKQTSLASEGGPNKQDPSKKLKKWQSCWRWFDYGDLLPIPLFNTL